MIDVVDIHQEKDIQNDGDENKDITLDSAINVIGELRTPERLAS